MKTFPSHLLVPQEGDVLHVIDSKIILSYLTVYTVEAATETYRLKCTVVADLLNQESRHFYDTLISKWSMFELTHDGFVSQLSTPANLTLVRPRIEGAVKAIVGEPYTLNGIVTTIGRKGRYVAFEFETNLDDAPTIAKVENPIIINASDLPRSYRPLFVQQRELDID